MQKVRNPCNCQSSKHRLISNCLNCGRIVCELEGSGPCLFCGKLVTTQKEKKIIELGTKKAITLKKTLLNKHFTKEAIELQKRYDKAVEKKNILLSFDKSNTKRTVVIDDQMDYFNTNVSSWISDTARKNLIAEEERLREKTDKLVISKSGYTTVYDLTSDSNPTDTLSQKMEKVAISYQNERKDDVKFANLKNDEIANNQVVTNNFVCQENSRFEIIDEGVVISVKQPYASLIVHGMQKCMTMSDIINHRGRVWVYSSDVLNDEDCNKIISNYTNSVKGKIPKFADIGVLLGFTNIIDCKDSTAELASSDMKYDMYGKASNLYEIDLGDCGFMQQPLPCKISKSFSKLSRHIHIAALKNVLYSTEIL
ncbi:hypothetical protein A3Q56_00016 [Intoshia linei]|uniref:TRIP4/RQT4 C2HC5-type zinc finger domain-containing protein n=1 Tax=Intoshia linei TaxID=1819745 RepID=A0A177BDB2_9BILA|nr:hypothetical protein A3Q56_00016 [Intoshia linei]